MMAYNEHCHFIDFTFPKIMLKQCFRTLGLPNNSQITNDISEDNVAINIVENSIIY